MCSWTGPYDQLSAHIDNCPLQVTQCEHCFDLMLRAESDDHIKVCPEMRINCEFCGKAVKKTQYKRHLNECGDVLIECSYEIYGCPAIFKRKHLQDHLDRNIAIHLELVKYSHDGLHDRVNKLELDMQRMKRKHKKVVDNILDRLETLEIELEYDDENIIDNE